MNQHVTLHPKTAPNYLKTATFNLHIEKTINKNY
jgi:hypothetical protein